MLEDVEVVLEVERARDQGTRGGFELLLEVAWDVAFLFGVGEAGMTGFW